MRSRKTSAPPSSGEQLALPARAKFDRYGLHAEDCECLRCELGARPSPKEREIARRVWERAEAAKREAAAKAAKEAEAAALGPGEVKHRAHAERLREREEKTRRYLEEQRRPVERPATPEELEELKRQFGFKARRRDGR